MAQPKPLPLDLDNLESRGEQNKLGSWMPRKREREKGEREERDEECSSEYEWRAVERVKVLMNCLRGPILFFFFLAFPGCKVQREPAVE